MLDSVAAMQTDPIRGNTTLTNNETKEHYPLMTDYKSYNLSGRTMKVIKGRHRDIICIFANAAHFFLTIHLHKVMDFFTNPF